MVITMKYQILPYPKELQEKDGFFSTKESSISVVGDMDPRVMRKVVELKDLLCSADGTRHKLFRDDISETRIVIRIDNNLKSEEYILEISECKVQLSGGDAQGCFYGIITLMQIINSYKNQLPALRIKDYPDFKYRGFYHDATRGRVPTVDGVKKIVDHIVGYKINSLQLYVEHTFDFDEYKELNRSTEEYLTAADIIEIDNYCYENFIDFIPSMSTFGHLYHLLELEKYKHLCELENYIPKQHYWRERQQHHTIDPTNPESWAVVSSMIDQYLPLFRSKYFNICCDETFDLCRDRNKGKDTGELYCDFVEKIINHVTACGKKVMMWNDVALKHSESLERLPNDTILLNWSYNAEPSLNNIDIISECGIPQIVCPGNSSWRRFIECPTISVPNITKMAIRGYEKGAIGLLNTNWGDEGHPCSFECALYGTAIGACMGWNVSTVIDEKFEKNISRVVYKTDINVIPLIKKISKAGEMVPWHGLLDWNRTNRNLIEIDVAQAEQSIAECEEIIKELSALSCDKHIFSHIITATQGIILILKAVIYLLTESGDTELWKKQINAWLEDYEVKWLQSNKMSELPELKKFIYNIL